VNEIREGSAGRYKQIKISVDPAVASAFKNACAALNVSMASVLSRFMADFSNLSAVDVLSPAYATRKQRRAAVQIIAEQLEKIKVCEENYRDRIPENLQNSVVYDRADAFASSLDEAIEVLAAV